MAVTDDEIERRVNHGIVREESAFVFFDRWMTNNSIAESIGIHSGFNISADAVPVVKFHFNVDGSGSLESGQDSSNGVVLFPSHSLFRSGKAD